MKQHYCVSILNNIALFKFELFLVLILLVPQFSFKLLKFHLEGVSVSLHAGCQDSLVFKIFGIKVVCTIVFLLFFWRGFDIFLVLDSWRIWINNLVFNGLLHNFFFWLSILIGFCSRFSSSSISIFLLSLWCFFLDSLLHLIFSWLWIQSKILFQELQS